MSRALVISNQYTQFSSARLYGCYNDANDFITRLRKIDPKMNITIMRDNLKTTHTLYPTKKNILREINNLCRSKETKLFFYYSGHGTSIRDYNQDEQTILFQPNGTQIVAIQGLLQDSCLVSNDINYLNIVTDDEISSILRGLKSQKTLYGFLDCCNSGTGFDLAFINLGVYTSKFTNNTIPKLTDEINTNCSIISSNYPDKINNIPAKVILISGTRDKDYSYEGQINNKVGGFFTYVLCNLLDYGVKNMSLKLFYFYLMALLNIPNQIPVLTLSKNLNLDQTLMNDLNFVTKSQLATKKQIIIKKHQTYRYFMK